MQETLQRTHHRNNLLILKNCIIVDSKNASYNSFYFIHEISCDIASYYRLSKFFKSYTGNNAELHFLILVSSVKDAIKFCSETKCMDKYCCNNDILTPHPNYNLTIRFMDYSPYTGPCSSPNLFLPSTNKIIHTKTL